MFIILYAFFNFYKLLLNVIIFLPKSSQKHPHLPPELQVQVHSGQDPSGFLSLPVPGIRVRQVFSRNFLDYLSSLQPTASGNP